MRLVPNEIVAEILYIERNIQFTRRAYGLDLIENQEFPAEEQLDRRDLERNEATIRNIRLWEHQPLLATYGQLQEIRTYYKFVDVDNDRYVIDGALRQVMLSARELSHAHLPSRIWINEHLTYTHGYGVVLGPVNQVTREGLPEFFIKFLTATGDTVMDIFAGSNTTGETAELLGRSWIALESDLEYVIGSAFRFMAELPDEEVAAFVQKARGTLEEPIPVLPLQRSLF